jgi:hypothetical protein
MSIPFRPIQPREFVPVCELGKLLESRKGAYPITITAFTQVDMNKTIDRKAPNPYYNRVTKRAKVNGMANWVYANSVNRQLEREGKEADFVPHARRWGVRLPNSPLVFHEVKHEWYLELKVEKSLLHYYFLDGQPISDEQVKPYLKPKGKSRQGVDKEIILRDYALANIEEVCMNGVIYEVTKPDHLQIAA